MDLRNHGSSPHADSMTLPEMAADVARAVQERGFSKCVLLGHSLGGRVAMLLALQQPELVDKLVVVDIAPVSGTFEDTQKIVDILAATDISTAKTRMDVDALLKSKIPDLGTRQFIIQNISLDGERVFWRINLPAIVNNMKAMSTFDFDYKPNPCEALFVKGQHSNYLQYPLHQAAVERYFPHAKLVVVPKAGHWVHADNPSYFVEVVNEFLAPKQASSTASSSSSDNNKPDKTS